MTANIAPLSGQPHLPRVHGALCQQLVVNALKDLHGEAVARAQLWSGIQGVVHHWWRIEGQSSGAALLEPPARQRGGGRWRRGGREACGTKRGAALCRQGC